VIPPNSREQDKDDKRSYWQRLVEFLHPGPDSREELLDALSDAEDNQVIGAESRLMLEGVLRMADLTAGHVMVAAPRMDLINLDAPLEDSLHQVIDTGHSRFPVYEGERDNLVGILLAKDLLKLQRAPELNIRTLLRPPVFVPESKSLNDLLREFRNTRNHMALVVDEFGRIAGLITIEDVLEQIVGDIEDEFDSQEDVGDIFALADRTYRVSGDASLERVGEAFGTHLEVTAAEENDDTHFDTIGGFIAHAMGHVPRRGEHFEINKLRFEVLHTRGGAVKWFKVYPAPTDKATP
jgi:magnesium and cobalt transporter